MEFSETAKFWLDSKKILALIIVLIVCARIFTAIVLPDTAYTDALYHLQITKEITKTGFLPFESNSKELAFMDMQGTVPQPFFHAALATIFVASGTGFGFELAGFFPVFITALQLALSFLLSRLFFENDKKAALIAFAFMAMQPVLAIYYSTNYTDAIAGLLVLFCFYLLVKFEKTKNHAFLFLLAFAAAAAAVSKLTAIAVVPALIVGLLYYASKSKIRNAKKIAAIAVLLILIVSAAAWFLPEFLRNQQNQELGFFQKFFGANAGQIDTLLELTPESYAKPHLSNPVALVAGLNEGFWFFLAPQLQSNIPAVNIVGIGTIQIIFAAFSLPLMLVFFYGFYKILRKREKYSFLILLIFLLGIIPFMVYLRNRVYPRMLLALIPFFGLIFAYGWREIKQQNLQKIVLALFAVMAVYSAVFMMTEAVYYRASFEDAKPAYEFIKTLPENSKIVAQRNLTRAIIVFAGHDTARDWDNYIGMNAEELFAELSKLKRESNVDYLLATCKKNPWKQSSLDTLEKQGKIKTVFSSACSRVYEIMQG